MLPSMLQHLHVPTSTAALSRLSRSSLLRARRGYAVKLDNRSLRATKKEDAELMTARYGARVVAIPSSNDIRADIVGHSDLQWVVEGACQDTGTAPIGLSSNLKNLERNATSSKKRVAVVFGGTGFLGQHVVAAMSKHFDEIRVATRGGKSVAAGAGGRASIVGVKCDVRNPVAVLKVVSGANAVVNLASVLNDESEATCMSINEQGAVTVAHAAKVSNVRHMVHVSAIGVSSSSNSLYGQTKYYGEAGVRNAFPSATIIKPSIIFGSNDHVLSKLHKLPIPYIPVIGEGNERFQPVYVGDVAATIAAAVTDAKVVGSSAASPGGGTPTGFVVECGGPDIFTFKELMHLVKTSSKTWKPIVHVPIPVARFLGAVCAVVQAKPMITWDQVEMMVAKDNVVTGVGMHSMGISPTPLSKVLTTIV